MDSGDNDDDESIKVIDNKRSCVERREQYLLFEAIVELRKTASEGNEATDHDSLPSSCTRHGIQKSFTDVGVITVLRIHTNKLI